MRFRHSFVPAMQRKYGDAFTVRLVPESRPLVLFKGAGRAKEIFASDPDVFHAGKGNAVLGPIMGEHSLLLVDGAKHKRARKLLMPAFRPSAMADYETVVTRLAREEVAGVDPRRRVPQPRADERADPRGDPAGRLRRRRRGPAGAAPAARQRHRRHQAAGPPRLGLSRPSRGSAPGRRSSTCSASSTRCCTPRSPSAVRPSDLHERTDVLSRLLLVGDIGGRGALERRRAAGPAGHPAAGRSRDHGRRAVLGALRAGARRSAACARRRRLPTRVTTTTSRRS